MRRIVSFCLFFVAPLGAMEFGAADSQTMPAVVAPQPPPLPAWLSEPRAKSLVHTRQILHKGIEPIDIEIEMQRSLADIKRWRAEEQAMLSERPVGAASGQVSSAPAAETSLAHELDRGALQLRSVPGQTRERYMRMKDAYYRGDYERVKQLCLELRGVELKTKIDDLTTQESVDVRVKHVIACAQTFDHAAALENLPLRARASARGFELNPAASAHYRGGIALVQGRAFLSWLSEQNPANRGYDRLSLIHRNYDAERDLWAIPSYNACRNVEELEWLLVNARLSPSLNNELLAELAYRYTFEGQREAAKILFTIAQSRKFPLTLSQQCGKACAFGTADLLGAELLKNVHLLGLRDTAVVQYLLGLQEYQRAKNMNSKKVLRLFESSCIHLFAALDSHELVLLDELKTRLHLADLNWELKAWRSDVSPELAQRLHLADAGEFFVGQLNYILERANQADVQTLAYARCLLAERQGQRLSVLSCDGAERDALLAHVRQLYVEAYSDSQSLSAQNRASILYNLSNLATSDVEKFSYMQLLVRQKLLASLSREARVAATQYLANRCLYGTRSMIDYDQGVAMGKDYVDLEPAGVQSAEMCLSLAIAYEMGIGVDVDYDIAYRYLCRALESGRLDGINAARANIMLAWFYCHMPKFMGKRSYERKIQAILNNWIKKALDMDEPTKQKANEITRYLVERSYVKRFGQS